MAASKNPKTVTLVAPDGTKHNSAHPAEINNLVFGQGYALADKGKTVDQAIADLGDNVVTPPDTV